MHYPKPFNPESGLNAVMAELAEQEENWTEASRQWTQAAKFSDKPEQCLDRARHCTELAFAKSKHLDLDIPLWDIERPYNFD